MYNANEIPEITIVFHDCVRVSQQQNKDTGLGEVALMGDPFALLDSLWSSAKSHEISFDNMLGIGRVEPKRQRSRKVIRIKDLVASWHDAARVIHADGLCKRRGTR
jgi:hypothetical protein